MSELYDQIVKQRGSVERLVARIPGFSGYMDRASRRTADRMLRDFVAGELAQRINRMATIEKKLVDQGGLMYMARTKSARTKMQTFHDRVKAAAPGYSGFFAAVKVGEEELARLYSFDEAQIRYVDHFDEALNALEVAVQNDSDVGTAIDALDAVAVEANDAFNLREDVLTNLDKSL
jgi:hypothetical protein